jgi:hypothetical protein
MHAPKRVVLTLHAAVAVVAAAFVPAAASAPGTDLIPRSVIACSTLTH